MPRNISDEEYNYLVGRKNVADLAESTWNKLGDEAKALLKKAHPDLPITDYDLKVGMQKQFDAFKKEHTDREEKKRKDEEAAEIAKKRAAAQKKFSLTDEGMSKVEELMKERYIGDYDVAASYYAAANPVPIEAGHDAGRWNHDKQKDWAEVAKDPERWTRNEIHNAVLRDEATRKGY